MPSSPMSLPEEHGHQCSLLYHPNLEWTPPESDDESAPSLPHIGWSNHVNPGASRYSGSSESPWMPASEPGRGCSVNVRAVPQFGPPSSALQLPLVTERMLGHNTSMVTTAVSPLLSNRGARRKCKAATETLAAMASRRRKTTRINAAITSRRRNAHDAPQIPSLSSSIRSNRIYVRIKRLAKEKAIKPRSYQRGDGRDRTRFGQSILVPGVRMQIINHYHHHHSEYNYRNPNSETLADANGNVGVARNPSLQGHHRSVGSNRNGNDLSHLPKHSRSNEKFLMTQRLLNLDMGPIAWRSIEELSSPPESFVWYLAHVLTEGVQVFLEHNTGKEYWIKHVSFWSAILDPGSHWWNMREGSWYKDIIRKLYASLRRRWGGSDFMECHGDNHVQKLYVRACIMFARRSSSKCS